MKIGKALLISSLLLFSCLFAVFGHTATIHNQDVCLALLGYSYKQDFNKVTDKNTRLIFNVIADALTLAVDYQAIKKTDVNNTTYSELEKQDAADDDIINTNTRGSEKYNDIKRNLMQLGQTNLSGYGIPNLNAASGFFSLGVGKHRFYNHQGFYADENGRYGDNEKRIQRWTAGKKLLIGCIRAALSCTPQTAEVIAVIAYYAHMVGDLAEGAQSSMEQMKPIDTIQGLVTQLFLDLDKALKKGSFSDDPEIMSLVDNAREKLNGKSTPDQVKWTFGACFPELVKKLLPYKDLQFCQTPITESMIFQERRY